MHLILISNFLCSRRIFCDQFSRFSQNHAPRNVKYFEIQKSWNFFYIYINESLSCAQERHTPNFQIHIMRVQNSNCGDNLSRHCSGKEEGGKGKIKKRDPASQEASVMICCGPDPDPVSLEAKAPTLLGTTICFALFPVCLVSLQEKI